MTTSLRLNAGYSDCIFSHCLDILNAFNVISGLITFIVASFELCFIGGRLKNPFRWFSIGGPLCVCQVMKG